MLSIGTIAAKVFGTSNDRKIKSYRPKVEAINALEPEMVKFSDAELRARSRGWTRRTIVTFHGSFFYFAEAYALTVATVVEPLPGQEPKPRYVARVVEAIRRSGAAAIFTEPQLAPGPARLIAGETGLPLFELDPVGGGPGAQSYEALLRRNAAVLDEALR